jgi:phosphoglucosamine mutase
VISASHNSYEDNGIKFFSAKGTKLSDEWETEVEKLVDETPVWVSSAELGKAKRLDDAAGRYIEFCKSTFSTEFSLKGMKIVVDAANGAAYQIAPKVFHELGAEVIAIGCSPNGLNINKDVGATHPEALVAAVKLHQADYGVALDGDADRLQFVDQTGRLYNGDELLYLMVTDRIARDEVVPGVVGTLMTNMAVELAIKAKNIEFVRSKVGDRYVLEVLQKNKWLLGGEGSGHLLALDKHTTGDGLISALQVLQACVATGRTMAELLVDVVLFPQVLINVRLDKDQNWQANTQLSKAIQEVEAELGQSGRVLIRASGTEPLLRVMVEAKSQEMAQRCAEKMAATLR